MRRLFGVSLLAMATLLLGVACTREAAPTLTAATSSAETDAGIQVTGTGTVSAAPDVATVRLGVELTGSTLASVQSSAFDQMNAVQARLRDLGIAAKDIKTVRFYVSPELRERDRTTTFRISIAVAAKVRNIDRVGAVVDGAIAAGANSVDSISFTIDEPEALQKQARQAAVADAKAKAEQLAGQAGVKLGKVKSIREDTSSAVRSEVMMLGGGAGAAPVSAGELDVTVRVQVIYAID